MAMLSAVPLPPTLMPAPLAPPAIWVLAVAILIKAVGKSAAVVAGASIWEVDEGDTGEGACTTHCRKKVWSWSWPRRCYCCQTC